VVFGAAATATAASAVDGRDRAQGADRVIVTDDNPRSEIRAIRAAILEGAPGAMRESATAARRSAARCGAPAGDVLLVAGKGTKAARSSATARCRSAITMRSRRRLREKVA
jgi:UDP-N-acetylmuramoyl-L-alanyl-D-glutamate--2,6-diaminopimelate ligase